MTENLQNRICGTCACAYVLEPPRIISANINAPPSTAQPVTICRLNPPDLIMTEGGPKIAQRQTLPYISCWSWKPAGTLPGDWG